MLQGVYCCQQVRGFRSVYYTVLIRCQRSVVVLAHLLSKVLGLLDKTLIDVGYL